MNPTISHDFPLSGISMKYNTIQPRKLGTINYKAYDKAYKPVKPFEIEGWDTETDKGLARVISTSIESKEISTPQEMIDFIFQRKHEKTLNLFYNLGFDSEVILKWFPDLLVEIKNNGCEGSWNGIHAKIIPKKFFSLSKNHHTISFFDVAQYFNMTLENASEKYLGENVSPLKQHRGELFTKFDIEEIKTYCMDDAHKTKELGKCFIKTLNNLGIYTKRIYSAGYISQIYTINNTFIPNFLSIPFRVQEFYYAAYRGGWFDTYRRGTIKCVNYDLKSAYPFTLSSIPDPTYGKWIRGYLPDAVCGVYRVEISEGEENFNPISVNIGGRNIYPIFDKPIITFITKGEYDAYKDFYKIRIIDGYSLVTTVMTYPYKTLVDKLYELKSSYENVDKGTYDTVKKIINSLYGKTAQKLSKTGRIGRLFNPYFAAECTARCRTKIFESLKDRQDKVVSVMTDGVLLEKPCHLSQGKNLGDWDKKFSDNTLIIQTGVYQAEHQEPHTRGFSIKKPMVNERGEIYLHQKETINLFEYLKEINKPEFKVYQFRPMHFKECITQKIPNQIGIFRMIEKEIDLNFDLKRIWFDQMKAAKNLLDHQYISSAPGTSLILD